MAYKRKAARRNKRQYTKRERPSKLALEVAAMLRARDWKIVDVARKKKHDAIVFGKDQDVSKAERSASDAFPNAGLKQTGRSTIIVPFPGKSKKAKLVTRKSSMPSRKAVSKKRQRRDTTTVRIDALAALGIDPKHTKKSTQFAVAVMRLLPSVAAQKHVMRLVLNGNSLPKTPRKVQKTDLSKLSVAALQNELAKRWAKKS